MTNVTKTYVPDREKLQVYIDRIYASGWMTNNGPLVCELQQRLQEHLGVKNLLLVGNGTLALQLAYRLLQLSEEVITTPFSFVATTSSLVWEHLQPVYADISPKSLNIDPKNLTAKISEKTSAIVATHVFGNACEVDEIMKIAKAHSLKVVFDAAHAFDVDYKKHSLLSEGDISILSFHATKLFHTIEGGALVINDDTLYEKAKLMINFGINGPDSVIELGINAKMNEFQAAMGLAVLDDISSIVEGRKQIYQHYEESLKDVLVLQEQNPDATRNYSYFPVIFPTEEQLLKVKKTLNDLDIFPRRYFYPSLDTLPYIQEGEAMQVSRHISRHILCLPIFQGLERSIQDTIINVVKGM